VTYALGVLLVAGMLEYRLRTATVEDAPVLAYHRRAMFEAMGILPADEVRPLEAATRAYLERAIAEGAYHGWVVELDGTVVAGGGLQLRPLVPRPGYTRGQAEGLIVSMWTEPAHRRRGLARQVLEAILAWTGANGVRRLTLHASDDGRPLYQLYGFKGTNEMRLDVGGPTL
jgi:GNAT superfamily N-acetyltransferase